MSTDVELAITGMTCASCAHRIERKLNKLDGVSASVNYATEKASVTYAGSVTTDDLLATVEAAGYAASLPSDVTEEPSGDPLRWRLLVAAVLSVPVVLLGMVPALDLPGADWVALAL